MSDLERRLLAGLTSGAGEPRSRRRRFGARLDLARSMGFRAALRKARERAPSVLPGYVRDSVYREIWTDAALRAQADCEEIGTGVLRLQRDGASTFVRQQMTALDDPVTLDLALDKAAVHRLLRRVGVPVPEHVEFGWRDLAPAERFLDATGGACVVKAADGTAGGEGTTAGVDTPVRLLRACLHAGRFGERLLIERQARGPVYRLLFLDGELIDVIRHLPPRLEGDGRSSIEDLIRAENDRRRAARGAAGLSLLGVGLDTVFTLERQDLGLSSVVARGEEVTIQTVTNDNRIEDTTTVGQAVEEEVVSAARRAAAVVGLRLAGVDVITPDPGVSLERAGGVVAEVNGTPGIHHHYHVADPQEATPVAVPILERVLEAARESAAHRQEQEAK